MALISLQNIRLSFGGDPLLDNVSLQIEPGQKICLLGRNGAGKTTLMRLINDELGPDAGTILRQPDLTVARLAQTVPDNLHGSVFNAVAAVWGDLLTDYHAAGLTAAQEGTPAAMQRLARAQHRLEAADGWGLQYRVETVLTQMGLAADAELQTLSGGLKRRVLLAQALVRQPDILLLDEPTNHLDIEAVCWLENYLKRFSGTVFMVTHDRAFMRALADRILELDRGAIFDWACDYDQFLKRKQQLLDDMAKQEARFDKFLSQEEVWIRQGIKARRTRNEGRVKRLEEMRRQRRARRDEPGQARITLSSARRSGDLVARTVDVTFGYDKVPVISGLTTVIERGDRVGIIGPNGCGKTTLLRLLLGELTPGSGTVQLGSQLEIVYFDQLRRQLDDNATVMETINGGNDKVQVGGQWRGVYSYLQDFLFLPERARAPVSCLSGGERNRLLLARLFTQAPNLLVMDEPTNDLDIETLELLEEKLLDFQGTLLLVSHDRVFLNNVVTSILVFEDGNVREYPGGYDDWCRLRPAPVAEKSAAVSRREASENGSSTVGSVTATVVKSRLSYKDTRELDQLPARIEEMERQQQGIYSQLSDPAFYQTLGSQVNSLTRQLHELDQKLAAAYERWDELERRRAGC